MCGICGILHFDGRPPSSEILSRMTESLRHRGPDAWGRRIDGPVGLGHRRLAIIDLSEMGSQPMANEDKTLWITYNGEIYNFKEVRADLEQLGHVFRSATDTEVILHAYENWGTECLSRFNGMFAFALWDSTRRRLWLVRDRLGIKPLFYSKQPDRLLFGSEIKAILCDPAFERQVDLEALHHFLSLNYTPAPFSLFKGIRQLLPGQYLLVEANGRCHERSYWDISYSRQKDGRESELCQEFDSVFADSVRRQMVSDVPLGAFLSGGVDSSALVYWMTQASETPVKTLKHVYPGG